MRKSTTATIIFILMMPFIVPSFFWNCQPDTFHVPPTNIIHNRKNGVYYWRTVFNLSDSERDFMKRQRVERMYLRMFDVTVGAYMPVPNASLSFATSVPHGI